MFTAILFSITLLTNCIENPEELSIYFEIAGRDTVDIGKFRGEICYRYYEEHKINFMLRIMKDTEVVFETGDHEIDLYNFSSDSTKAIYANDIDGDGTLEFILHCNSGGQQCCNGFYVYSLYEKPVIRDSVVCYNPIGQLDDLDGDGIPEIFCGDDWFLGWKAHWSKSAGFRLIWKWDGERYRLANFKFADYLLEQAMKWWKYDKIPTPEILEGLHYDPDLDEPDFPPVQLWGRMLVYIYTGESNKADSLFDDYWPEEIPGKEEFYRDFRWHLERNGHWQQLLESDW
ncbi:MAG: hypothetical protein V3U02_06405 [Calditrichia bacterium]